MIGRGMPAGYRFLPQPDAVAQVVLGKSTWSVLALTCHIELFVQSHYAESIAPREELCPLFRDIFQFHWRDECQHVVLDELEWKAEHERLSASERDRAVGDLIALVGAVDGILREQSAADAGYFCASTGRAADGSEGRQIAASILAAYRWQYIISGVQHPHFGRLLTRMTTADQMARITAALAPILGR